jgi:uncharacterized protein YuzE
MMIEEMRITYDPKVDALDISLHRGASVAKTVCIDERRNVDLDAHGDAIAIEILWASEGVVLDDVVERFGLYEFKDDFRRVSQMTFSPAVAT